MVSLKLSTLGPEIRKNWGVGGSLLIFMVAYEYFRTRRMVWQRFAKIGLGPRKICCGKRNKSTAVPASEMGDRLATTDIGQKLWAVPLWGRGSWVPN